MGFWRISRYSNSQDDFDKQLPMAEKIFQAVQGLGKGTTGPEKQYNSTDEQLTLEENAEINNWCNDPTNQLAKEICDTILS